MLYSVVFFKKRGWKSIKNVYDKTLRAEMKNKFGEFQTLNDNNLQFYLRLDNLITHLAELLNLFAILKSRNMNMWAFYGQLTVLVVFCKILMNVSAIIMDWEFFPKWHSDKHKSHRESLISIRFLWALCLTLRFHLTLPWEQNYLQNL